MQTQKILFLLIGVTLLFFVTSKLLPQRKMPANVLQEEKSAPSQQTPVQEPSAAKPYDYYGKAVEERNLFQPGLPPKDGRSPAAPVSQTHLGDFALIGIISGKTPQAIIEDKKENKTYFLKEGELLGQMRVEQILDDKVTLSFEGEQLELVL